MSRSNTRPRAFSWVAGIALAGALTAGAYGAPGLLPASASSPAATRVGNWFLFGANMPWLNWNADFGGGPGGGGVSGNISEVDTKLQAAQNAGMHVVRWWVFEGGSPQIQRDSSGTPTGLNPNVYTDLDVALNEASKYDISYDLVLFGSTNDDATSHQWWEDSAKRQALVNVLTPLFRRYANNPRVHTWELVNEPEWQSRNAQTTTAGMLATGDALANAIHQNSRALVTVGNAQIQDMVTWVGHPIDYYSPHYYDNFGTGSNDPFVTSASAASPDGKAVVIGEFPASSGLTPDAQSRWQALYANGYAGGWNWSLSPEHTGDKIATDFNAAAAFASGKSDLGPRLSGSAPTSTPVPVTATPMPPTSTPVPPTSTAVPPTATAVPPTSTAVPGAPAPAPSTATATPATTTTWALRASSNPTSVTRGSTVNVTARVTASRSARALVDVEIYDQNWNKVYQRAWDNQAFTANVARTYTTSWTLPADAPTGTYTVMVGTFGSGWNGMYSFNNSAAKFTGR